PNDPLSLVFVCAMWLTGFDAPSCSTVYLDKPMRNHTLIQTIARANRVYPGKHSGVVVDYANVFESLEKALALYGTAGSARTTVSTLSEKIREATTPGRADITEVLQRIGQVLDHSIEGVLMVKEGPPAIDLSRIDFKALAAKFKNSKAKNLDLERLKAAIRAQL